MLKDMLGVVLCNQGLDKVSEISGQESRSSTADCNIFGVFNLIFLQLDPKDQNSNRLFGIIKNGFDLIKKPIPKSFKNNICNSFKLCLERGTQI